MSFRSLSRHSVFFRKMYHEIYSDLFGSSIPKIHIAAETAFVQVYSNLLCLCLNGISKTWLFCRTLSHGVSHFKMQPLLSCGV